MTSFRKIFATFVSSCVSRFSLIRDIPARNASRSDVGGRVTCYAEASRLAVALCVGGSLSTRRSPATAGRRLVGVGGSVVPQI